MKNGSDLSEGKLAEILRTFTKEEWAEFEKFTASPYFNKGRNYKPLLTALRKFHPYFRSDDFSMKNIYRMMFPGKPYKESVMKSMLSRLDELADEFITQIALNKNDLNIRERCYIKEASARGLRKRAASLIRKTDAQFSSGLKGLLDHISLRDYLNEVSNHYYMFDEVYKEVEKVFEYQKYILYGFLTEFLITEGTIYSQRNSWHKATEADYVLRVSDTLNLNEVLAVIKENDPENFLVLDLFNTLRLATRNIEDHELYFSLKEKFFGNKDLFDLEFRSFMMNCLTAIATSKGKKEFIRESFELKKRAYDENLYMISKSSWMRLADFRSTFLEAIYLDDLKWAEQFARQYTGLLQPAMRKDMQAYCRAQLYNARGKFDEALAQLNNVRINTAMFKLDIRMLTSMIYFDTGSFESLYSYLDSYSKFLDNLKSQNKSLISSHAKFIRYIRKLANIKLREHDDAEANLLGEKIRTDLVIHKKWLYEKVKELTDKPEK